MKFVQQQFNSTRRINPGAYSKAAKNLTNAVNNLYETQRETAPDFSRLAQVQQNINTQLEIEAIKAQRDITKAGISTLGQLTAKKEILKGEEALRKGKRAGKLMLYGGGAIMQGIKMASRKPIKKPEPIYGVETPFQVPDSSPYAGALGRAQGQLGELGPAPVMPDPNDPSTWNTGLPGVPGVQQNNTSNQTMDTPPQQPPAQVQPAPAQSNERTQAFQKILNIAQSDGRAKFPAVVAAKAMHETGHLSNPNSVFFRTNKTNAFGQTGDRGWGTIPRPGYKDGWTIYPDLATGVKDHITLWHDTGNHPENYNAHPDMVSGIRAITGKYSPNNDPANIQKGYDTGQYNNSMVGILRENGYL